MNYRRFVARGYHYLVLVFVLFGIIMTLAAAYDIAAKELAFMEFMFGSVEDNWSAYNENVTLEVPRIYG